VGAVNAVQSDVWQAQTTVVSQRHVQIVHQYHVWVLPHTHTHTHTHTHVWVLSCHKHELVIINFTAQWFMMYVTLFAQHPVEISVNFRS